MKNKCFDNLLDSMSNCEKCMHMKKRNGKDCSLINIYSDINFCKNIPSIWTDWYSRLDANIMIIGQDWGPYTDMVKFHKEYINNKTSNNWKRLINKEKSLTKKLLEKYIIESASFYNIDLDDNFLDKVFITNAIMCARSGNNYRADNINLKDSTLNCSNFLIKQIEIVKPKVILTLGYYPLLSLSKYFNFDIRKTLTETIKLNPIINADNFVIIPLYHPTAQVKKENQLEQYKRIWNNLSL